MSPTTTAAACRHLDCALVRCTRRASLTSFPSAPTISPRHGAGPFIQSVLWGKRLRPRTQAHSASAGPHHRGPYHPGLAARFPCGSPGWNTRSLPCLWEEGSPCPPRALLHPAPMHSQPALPFRPREPRRPLRRPSLSSQALTGCGGEASPGPNLLPDLPSVLLSAHFQAMFRRCSQKQTYPVAAEVSAAACSRPSLHPGCAQAAAGQPAACASPPCAEEVLKAISPQLPGPGRGLTPTEGLRHETARQQGIP